MRGMIPLNLAAHFGPVWENNSVTDMHIYFYTCKHTYRNTYMHAYIHPIQPITEGWVVPVPVMEKDLPEPDWPYANMQTS
jgi:hypothetical protein